LKGEERCWDPLSEGEVRSFDYKRAEARGTKRQRERETRCRGGRREVKVKEAKVQWLDCRGFACHAGGTDCLIEEDGEGKRMEGERLFQQR